jgi:NAD(P)-dependent dehydrogenase (short-subunit alcohol dehydrogenase family)
MKTVLITGANRGIGFEVARQLAQLGHFVYMGSRDLERGRKAKQNLEACGIRNVEVVELDVTNIDSIQKAKRTLEDKIEKLDILINNAGIRGEIPQPASKTPLRVMREVFETNFFGAIQVAHTFLPLLEKSELPVIVNVTSDLGSLAFRSDPASKSYSLERAAYGRPRPPSTPSRLPWPQN